MPTTIFIDGSAGRDIEAPVLARLVKMHLEKRVLLNGCKTDVYVK